MCASERYEVAGGDPLVVGTHDAVDEADRELEPLRVLEQTGEALGGRVGAPRRSALWIDPGADELNTAFGKGQFGHLVAQG